MRHLPDALMLFAAGFGTRMGDLTADRPKPLIEVGGRALIDHALEQARDAGLGRIVVNVHYLADQVRSHLADSGDILISDETETILETGGGLKNALPLLGGDTVFTLNTDAVWTGFERTGSAPHRLGSSADGRTFAACAARAGDRSWRCRRFRHFR